MLADVLTSAVQLEEHIIRDEAADTAQRCAKIFYRHTTQIDAELRQDESVRDAVISESDVTAGQCTDGSSDQAE